MSGDFYLTDKEIARRLGMSVAEWTATASVLEKHGLPRKDALFQYRRCWPAVVNFLIERATPGPMAKSGTIPEGYLGFKPKRLRPGKNGDKGTPKSSSKGEV
jgi:hypothetical protein